MRSSARKAAVDQKMPMLLSIVLCPQAESGVGLDTILNQKTVTPEA